MPHTLVAPPADILHPPVAPYSHAFLVQPNLRWLYVSGQVALAPDGSIPDGIEAQTKLVWDNLFAILAEARMDMADVVKLTHFVVGPEHLPGYNAARMHYMGDARPTSTLLVISALARPEFLVEVELVAAKA